MDDINVLEFDWNEDDNSSGSEDGDFPLDEDLDGLNETFLDNEAQPQERTGHVAVRVDKYIIMFGGYVSYEHTFHGIHISREQYLSHEQVWLYDLDSEHWSLYQINGNQDGAKSPQGTSGACAALLNGEIYMMFGHTEDGNTNTIWKLSRCSNQSLQWKEIKIGNELEKPSPRDKLVAWEHDDKLWAFGGFGPPLGGFLNKFGNFRVDDAEIAHLIRGWNNQLFTFDPEKREWTNLDPGGAVPSPRAAHAAAKVGSKVWMFGGRSGNERLDDFYELDLSTVTWSKVNISSIEKPFARSWHSLTPTTSGRLLLYGGYSNNRNPLGDSWLFDTVTKNWHQKEIPGNGQHLHDDGVENNQNQHDLGLGNDRRLWHTGTAGFDGDVLVFGGCTNDILDQQNPTVMSQDLLCIQTQPKSLLRLGLHAVYEVKELLKGEWASLPRNLAVILKEKCRGEEARLRKKSNSVHIEEDQEHQGMVSCVIS